MATRKTSAAARPDGEITEAAESAPIEQEEPKKIVPKDIDVNQYITVRNGFHGMLVYKSARTGELFEWERFGDEQIMELRELKNAKSTAKKFFMNNWFLFDDEYAWVIDYLGVRQYYSKQISIDGFDDIFKLSPEKLRETVSAMSDGLKSSVAYRAFELMAAGEIDSIKQIRALEDALGFELTEK